MAKSGADAPSSRHVAMQPAALNLNDAALYVALSTSTVQLLMRGGDFPQARRLSAGRVAFLVRELDAWLESRPIAAMLPPPNTGHRRRLPADKRTPGPGPNIKGDHESGQ